MAARPSIWPGLLLCLAIGAAAQELYTLPFPPFSIGDPVRHPIDAMLLAIGLPRETVFIANILKCRPPGNRDPKPEEVSRCLPFLSAQIALLKPKIMLAVGRIAAQNLLATDAPLARLRGKLHHFGEANTPLVITYHPAYLLRTPGDKRKAWDDLKFARATYQRLTGAN